MSADEATSLSCLNKFNLSFQLGVSCVSPLFLLSESAHLAFNIVGESRSPARAPPVLFDALYLPPDRPAGERHDGPDWFEYCDKAANQY